MVLEITDHQALLHFPSCQEVAGTHQCLIICLQHKLIPHIVFLQPAFATISAADYILKKRNISYLTPASPHPVESSSQGEMKISNHHLREA